MTHLISIDAGITTGIAVFDLNGELLNSESVDVKDLPRRLRSLFLTFEITHGVIETPVIVRGKLGDILTAVMEVIEESFSSVEPMRVEANWWKSHPLAMDSISGVDVHVRDAIRMGRVYLRRELRAL